MHLETEPAILVARLLLGRLPRVHRVLRVERREVRGQCAEHLGRIDGRIHVDRRRVRQFGLTHDRHVAIIRKLQELEAAPVAGGRRAGGAVGIGVAVRAAERIEARVHAVVSQRRHHDRIPGLPEHLHGAADPVVDVERDAARDEARIGAERLDDEARVGLAEEPQAGRGVEVAHLDLTCDHVDDVGVVPHTLDGEFLAPHLHAGGRATRRAARGRVDRVRDAIVPDERTEVVVEPTEAIDRARAAARVALQPVVERVGVDADERAAVVAEVVAHDRRLGAPHEDGRGGVRAAAGADPVGR